MNENVIPKWQRELQTFLGIKSCVVLEGNVYDEYPIFISDEDELILDSTDDLNHAILSLINPEQYYVFTFDPVAGFDNLTEIGEEYDELIKNLFDGYQMEKTGLGNARMPSGKDGCGKDSQGTGKFVWVSEIIRRAVTGQIRLVEPKEDQDVNLPEKKIIFIMNFASRLDACNIRACESNTMFMNLMAAMTAVQPWSQHCNSILMIVDKYNDIPAWVYMNNPNIRTISVCTPERAVRRMYLTDTLWDVLEPYRVLGEPDYAPGKQFVAETEGMRLQEIRQILQMAYHQKINPEDIQQAFRLFKYGVLDSPWENLENDILVHIESKLDERVKGQSEAISKVKTVVTRAVKGLSGMQHSGASHKPKGILFFAGPTGVGKTETAKALAESIFGDENACVRFDMSEYRLEQSDQKLFGAPPGYVGYEGGGQLTNAVKNRPFSVLLFDEIEKASPTILDKFLQILEDGRMTDNHGNTVYFGETIIIFTSNLGLTKEVPDMEGRLGATKRVPTITIENPMTEDTEEFRTKVTQMLTDGVEDYFTNIGRPELLNRLGTDNIVVFQFIGKKEAQIICDYKLKKICQAISEEKGFEIQTDEVQEYLREQAVLERANGGRGVGNMLEREFLNPLAGYICTLEDMPALLRCKRSENGIEFEVVS